MTETFRCEYVRCGKSGCKSCPHGPYWYAYQRIAGKLKKRYIGKERPDYPDPSKQGAPREPHPWDAIYSRWTASSRLAREILGVDLVASHAECQAAYRVKVKEHHPDRGGDHDMMMRVNAAWSYINKLFEGK